MSVRQIEGLLRFVQKNVRASKLSDTMKTLIKAWLDGMLKVNAKFVQIQSEVIINSESANPRPNPMLHNYI